MKLILMCLTALCLFLISLIYWCIDEKKGLHLGILVLIFAWINMLLESLFIQPGAAASLIPFILIFCGYFLLYEKIEMLLEKGGFRAKMISSAVLSFIMILHLPNRELLAPAGAMLGFCTGYCLNIKYIGFTSNAVLGRTGAGKYLTLSIRLILGITGFVLIYFAAGKLIPWDSANYKLYGFLHAALGGLWVSAAAPWVFTRLRLAGKKPDE
jgi:hypothetical protein